MKILMPTARRKYIFTRYVFIFSLCVFLVFITFSRPVYAQAKVAVPILSTVVAAGGVLAIAGAISGGRNWFFTYKQFPIVQTERMVDRAQVRADVEAATALHWVASKRKNEDLFSDVYHNTLQIKYKWGKKYRLRLIQPRNNKPDPLTAYNINFYKARNLKAKRRGLAHKFVSEEPLLWLEKIRHILWDLGGAKNTASVKNETNNNE